MTDNTTLDAAVLSGMMAVGGHPTNDEQRRTYARALIAKLLEGMEPPIMHDRIHPGIKHGFDFAITEIRRRAGIEGDK
ncbi:MAG: hypothetical protein ACK5X3_13135 [Pseudomonadota bacterium]|jgi:hypothetical protein